MAWRANQRTSESRIQFQHHHTDKADGSTGGDDKIIRRGNFTIVGTRAVQGESVCTVLLSWCRCVDGDGTDNRTWLHQEIRSSSTVVQLCGNGACGIQFRRTSASVSNEQDGQ